MKFGVNNLPRMHVQVRDQNEQMHPHAHSWCHGFCMDSLTITFMHYKHYNTPIVCHFNIFSMFKVQNIFNLIDIALKIDDTKKSHHHMQFLGVNTVY